MRAWTTSACVVLAWSILPITLVTAGRAGSVHPAQANTRTHSLSKIILTNSQRAAAAPMTATSPAGRYVVQPGDTLSGIAARFAVRGGWPALYAANRQAIGPDPNILRVGTVLAIPRLAPPAPPVPGPALPQHPASAPSARAGTGPPVRPTATAPPAASMPHWLKTLLAVLGLLILAAFLTEPVLALRRRRRQATIQAAVQRRRRSRTRRRPAPVGSRPDPAPERSAAQHARIVFARHHRLIVTHDPRDGTVCVLRPSGADPHAILRAGRLVLSEGLYEELAARLGLPASWPVQSPSWPA